MASMSITADRMQTIDFSDKYYNTPTVIVAAKDSTITPDAEGLKGAILGVQVSTVHQDYAQTHFADSVAEIKGAVDVKIIRFTAEVAPVLASARLKSSEGARHTYLSADADGAVRELVEHGVAFSSLEVIAASLDQAVSEVLRSAS